MTKKKNRAPLDTKNRTDFRSFTEKETDSMNPEMSITEMIDRLTLEASEMTQTNTFDFDDPVQAVKAEDDDKPEVRRFHLATLAVLVLGVLVLAGALFVIFRNVPSTDTAESTENTPAQEYTPEPGDVINPDSEMTVLRDEILEITQASEGEWSVYVENLNTGERFTINDVQMPSASLIKLFTAARYLEMVENGELEETEDSAFDLYAMICWSDNEAWVDLETFIGYGDYNAGLMSVTDFAQRYGFERTGRLIGDETIFGEEADNLTAAAETGSFLSGVYRGTIVSEAVSQHLYELLSEQTITYKIPAGLPEGFVFASKSGELPGIENDAAIVKGTDTDFVLAVLGNEIWDSWYGADVIARISRVCAERLNPSIAQ